MAYNGWENYETWCVALWLDNEPGTYHHFTERARDLVEDNTADDDTDEDIRAAASALLAQELETYHDESMPDVTGVYSDLLRASLGAVDWREIAEHYCAEVEIERPEPEEEDEEMRDALGEEPEEPEEPIDA